MFIENENVFNGTNKTVFACKAYHESQWIGVEIQEKFTKIYFKENLKRSKIVKAHLRRMKPTLQTTEYYYILRVFIFRLFITLF